MMLVPPPLLAIGGPPGAGKSSIAAAAAKRLDAAVVGLGDSTGEDQHAVDLVAMQDALDDLEDVPLVIVEGVYALALPPIRWAARWTVYVDTPDRKSVV